MTTTEQYETFERIEKVYDFLVDQTENPNVFNYRAKSDLLSKLLALMEYLQCEDNENPVPEWFE